MKDKVYVQSGGGPLVVNLYFSSGSLGGDRVVRVGDIIYMYDSMAQFAVSDVGIQDGSWQRNVTIEDLGSFGGISSGWGYYFSPTENFQLYDPPLTDVTLRQMEQHNILIYNISQIDKVVPNNKSVLELFGESNGIPTWNGSSFPVNEALGYTAENIANKNVANGYAGLDSNGLIPISLIPGEVKSSVVVNNISERNALIKYSGMRVIVLNATDDPTVTSGGAEYLWSGSEWIKLSETESMDLVLDWNNIVNKPSASPTAIDQAITNSHTHSNKLTLDKISESAGLPTWNGGAWPGSNVQWTDIINRPTSSPSAIDNAVNNLHTHSNKSVLDLLTSTIVNGLVANPPTVTNSYATINDITGVFKVAGESLPANTVVRISYSDGKVYRANSNNVDHLDYILGITVDSVVYNEQVYVKFSGEISFSNNPNFVEGKVYLNGNGTLSQTAPTSGFQQIMGYATSSDKMIIRMREPVVL